MNGKIGLRAFSTFLAAMLVSVVAVPAVSAEAQTTTGVDLESTLTHGARHLQKQDA